MPSLSLYDIGLISCGVKPLWWRLTTETSCTCINRKYRKSGVGDSPSQSTTLSYTILRVLTMWLLTSSHGYHGPVKSNALPLPMSTSTQNCSSMPLGGNHSLSLTHVSAHQWTQPATTSGNIHAMSLMSTSTRIQTPHSNPTVQSQKSLLMRKLSSCKMTWRLTPPSTRVLVIAQMQDAVQPQPVEGAQVHPPNEILTDFNRVDNNCLS